MGKNLRLSMAAASGTMSLGRDYLTWTATGAAMGAIKYAGNKTGGVDDRTSLARNIKAGALTGFGLRAAGGMIRGSAARRRLRNGGV